ncbi:hypothetical protein OA503_03170 [Prochlorococcus sp. AH-716-K03]|nr:hypothetical protein [Prochlorococcus sp. AH-716-K03]
MASAYQDINKDFKIITSFKPGKGINNKYLNSIHSSTFKLSNDLLLICLNIFYYNSTAFIKRKIKKYYEPFIDKNNIEREMKYIDYLESSSDFPWRRIGRDLIIQKKSSRRNIIIAMRTSYFNEKKRGVSSQPWRDVSVNDIYKIIQASNEIKNEEKIYCFTNKKVWERIQKMQINLDKIDFIDENNNDILDIINEDTLLINNGNGIGATIYALGIKTLYLHHTVWHFWHSSHSNGLAYPCVFKDSKNRINDLQKIIKLAFLPEYIPYDFEENFYKKGVFHNQISDLSVIQIQNSIIEALNIKSLGERSSAKYLGVEFYYKDYKEKYFWELFIKNQPKYFRKFSRKISLNIASEFLNSYI